MQQQQQQQREVGGRLSSSMTPFKKRLLHRAEEHYSSSREKEDEEFKVDKSERRELEYKGSYYDAEDDGWGMRGVERSRKDRFREEYSAEGDPREVEEEELADGNLDDHHMEQDIFNKERQDVVREKDREDVVREKERQDVVRERERHDVVRERQKRRELEVFVGGLDRDTNESDLREVFSQVGDITEVRLLMNQMTGKNKGFAFIRFATVEQSRRALNELKHPVINGKQCGVAQSQDSDTLFVGNICKSWTKEMLKEKLIRYGIEKFEELTLVEDTKNEGMNRGFAFLDFPSRADAYEACRRLQRRDVVFGTDRTARVAFADTFIEPDDEIMAQVKTVFVDGLPSTWDEELVREHLKQFGRIEKVELARNMPAAQRDDFGFVTFNTHEAAVSCVDGVNETELFVGDKKVKVRARLSRPRQRGKSAKHARGGYPVGLDGYGRGRSSWDYGMSRIDHRFSERDRRSVRSRSPYDGVRRRSPDSRDKRLYEDSVVDRAGDRRQFPSDRSLKRRSPVYSRGNFESEYARQDDSFATSRNLSRASTERQSYRDSYISRGSGYLDDSSRRFSRVAARKTKPHYDDDDDEGYEYVEHSSSYNDGSGRNYSSISGLKRPYSSIEESHPGYVQSSRRPSRAGLDYGSNSDMLYSDRFYGSDSTRLGRGSRSEYSGSGRSSAGQTHGHYDRSMSNIGYRRGDINNEEPEEMFSRYGRDRESRDYLPSRSELRSDSYSPLYSNHRSSDGYAGGRVSDSYY